MTQIERTVSATSTKLTARSLSCSTTSSTRKQNRSEFAKYYTDLCHIQHSHPINAIKQNLDKGILDFYCDRIKFDEWWSIINALGSDKTLHLIAIRSRHPQKQAIESADTELKARSTVKQPAFATRFVLLWLMESIKLCLSQSTSLAVLELEGLPLAGDYLVSLSRGLVETTSLQHLSFYKCYIGDEGAEVICHTIKNLPCIISLDLSYCELTERGADLLAEMVRYQKLNRYSEAWKQTLRYRDPDVEAMPGLRRITINGNNIGDKGIAALTEEIKDDLWLRALDVQDCGLTDAGGTLLLDLLRSNRNLVIVDARGNPCMSEEVLTDIMDHLAANNHDKKDTDYRWINKNPNLNKKNFQVTNLKPRPWSCNASSRLPSRTSVPSGWDQTGSSRKIPQLITSNTKLSKKKSNKIDGDNSESECLKMQLRDLTLLLNQEMRHKLLLLEENKKLKELLEECEADKKKLEKVQGNKVLIAEDTLKVLEETIKKFGRYIHQQQEEEDEETSESVTARSILNESDIPDVVSDLKCVIKKAACTADNSYHENKAPYLKHKDKVKYYSSETELPAVKMEHKKVVTVCSAAEAKGEKPEEISDNSASPKSMRFNSRQTEKTIYEEDETGLSSGDSIRTVKNNDGNKRKAQVMFMKILEEGMKNKLKDGQFMNTHIVQSSRYDDDDNDEDSASDDSVYNARTMHVQYHDGGKHSTSSNEENSS